MESSHKTKKTIALLTIILTSGGLDRQIISLCEFFIENGYTVYIYSLLPKQQFNTLVKSSEKVIINYPKNKNGIYTLFGLIKNSPIIIRLFISLFPNTSNLKNALREVLIFNIQGKYILDRYFLDLYSQLKRDNRLGPFEFVIGFSYQTIPYLSRIKTEMRINSKYFEISSPKWRQQVKIDESGCSIFLKNIDDIIVPSKIIGEELLQRYSLNRSYSIIPLYLKMPQSLTSPDIDKYPLSFGLAARFSQEKNQDLLIKIMHHIKTKYGYVAFKLILVGSGSTEKKLREMAKEMDLEENVVFLGHVENILDFINHIGVVVLLSDVESLSATLLESLYFGKPVVATDVGSTRDLLVDGFNGFLIKDKYDIDDIARKIISILSDKERYYTMSKNSRAIYDSSYANVNLKLKEFFQF